MRYLSIKYWFELWLWATPILNNLLQTINAKAIYNDENIKGWNDKNISNLDVITSRNSNKAIACVHEAGHTIIALNSEFKNNFQQMEFLSKDDNHYGKTTFNAFLPLTPLTNITNSQLATLLHTDLGGFAAESIVFNIDFFKNIIDEGRVMGSNDLKDYHETYQKEFEIRNLKFSNEKKQHLLLNKWKKPKR